MPKASIVLWLRSRQTYLAVASLHATPPSPFLFLLCVAAFSHVLSKRKWRSHGSWADAGREQTTTTNNIKSFSQFFKHTIRSVC
jgi:hypothetical protein